MHKLDFLNTLRTAWSARNPTPSTDSPSTSSSNSTFSSIRSRTRSFSRSTRSSASHSSTSINSEVPSTTDRSVRFSMPDISKLKINKTTTRKEKKKAKEEEEEYVPKYYDGYEAPELKEWSYLYM